MSRRTAGWEFLLEDTLISGIVSSVESYAVVAIQRARVWTRFLLKIGFLLEVVDGTAAGDRESHEERRAAGSQGREDSGAREVVFIVVVVAGSQWWTPRAFLDIFAFLRSVVRVVRRSLRSRSPQQRADSGSRGGHRHLRPGGQTAANQTLQQPPGARTGTSEELQIHDSLEVMSQSSMPIIHIQPQPQPQANLNPAPSSAFLLLSTTSRPIRISCTDRGILIQGKEPLWRRLCNPPSASRYHGRLVRIHLPDRRAG
jgi:hypothetical protein